MPVKGSSTVRTLRVYDLSNNTPVTGATLTLRGLADGVEFTPTATEEEPDDTNLPGRYTVALTGSENSGDSMLLGGLSSSGVILDDIWENSTSAVGSGASSVEIVCEIAGVVRDGVACWITTDEAGTNIVAGTVYSDTHGVALFTLDPGTYYLWRQLAFYNFDNPQEITVE